MTCHISDTDDASVRNTDSLVKLFIEAMQQGRSGNFQKKEALLHAHWLASKTLLFARTSWLSIAKEMQAFLFWNFTGRCSVIAQSS